jgi:hypothetical protein
MIGFERDDEGILSIVGSYKELGVMDSDATVALHWTEVDDCMVYTGSLVHPRRPVAGREYWSLVALPLETLVNVAEAVAQRTGEWPMHGLGEYGLRRWLSSITKRQLPTADQ